MAELNRWAQLAGVLPKHARLSLTRGNLSHVRNVREELYGIFRPLALGTSLSSRSLAVLDAMYARVVHKRRLTREEGNVVWHWDASLGDPDRVLGPIVLSATELVLSERLGKIRQCEGERCGWLFVDRSRAGHRRWCSMADCGNREKARRHYRQLV